MRASRTLIYRVRKMLTMMGSTFFILSFSADLTWADDLSGARHQYIMPIYVTAAQSIVSAMKRAEPIYGYGPERNCTIKHDVKRFDFVGDMEIQFIRKFSCGPGSSIKTRQSRDGLTMSTIGRAELTSAPIEYGLYPPEIRCRLFCKDTRKACFSYEYVLNTGHHDRSTRSVIISTITAHADVCRALSTAIDASSKIESRLVALYETRRKRPECPAAVFENMSEEDKNTISYVLARDTSDIQKTQACMSAVFLVNKIKFTSFVVAQLNITLKYVIGHNTDCFSEYPLGFVPGFGSCQDVGIAAPAKLGEQRVIRKEIRF